MILEIIAVIIYIMFAVATLTNLEYTANTDEPISKWVGRIVVFLLLIPILTYFLIKNIVYGLIR